MSIFKNTAAAGVAPGLRDMPAAPARRGRLAAALGSIRNGANTLLHGRQGKQASPVGVPVPRSRSEANSGFASMPPAAPQRASIATLLSAKVAVKGHIGLPGLARRMDDALLLAWGNGASDGACIDTLTRIGASAQASPAFHQTLQDIPREAAGADHLPDGHAKLLAECLADSLLLVADEQLSSVARLISDSILRHFDDCRDQQKVLDKLAVKISSNAALWTHITPQAERFCRMPTPGMLRALVRCQGPRHVAARILLLDAYQAVIDGLLGGAVRAFHVNWDDDRYPTGDSLGQDIALVQAAAITHAEGRSPEALLVRPGRGRSQSMMEYMRGSELAQAGIERALDQTSLMLSLRRSHTDTAPRSVIGHHAPRAGSNL
ncbi:TPA: hypothetical protein QDZ75_004445 [Stenotrophomonas maltophilia]|uniref:Uncharacterized protein n=1 Tax=Stenotrophomonas maltophilia TaxID=40324 RepID=A0A2J0UDQ3_STEMA|nr:MULTISPECIES: hypothetical protein [Stenotrophomonas]PJL31572.1 hypothetical protein B9Y64_08335 [Stenotrophomonas maltophilia]HDS1140359.1 hypothetical protein [Stenotrophomonas maltophilia]HDS1145628.1 hypothetical protein [Stenotrophomonas maltophilia]HDS1163263.1 hypothetical protein [Stenotrophomonas maltophilia]